MLSRTILAFIAGALVTATAHGAYVDGYAFLEDAANYCGTKVEIDASAMYPLAYTNSSGLYAWPEVAAGPHTFTYSHVGYHPQSHVFSVAPVAWTLPDVQLETKSLCDPASWQEYPYALPNTTIAFPVDEGRHDPLETYPTEWWYGNFHLTGEQSGKEYAAFVAFFRFPPMVLFSISDLEQEVAYSDDKYPLVFYAHDQWLDITAGLPPCDRWYNKECEGDLLPFEYHLFVSGMDDEVFSLDLDMKSLRPPLPVGGDGLIEVGDGWSYYYSHTRLDVLGTIYVPGLTEGVQGYGWIDHQWGGFTLWDNSTTWEWFAIQFDDHREIMVADTWVNGELQDTCFDGLNLYDENCLLEVLPDYTITPLAYWTDSVSGRTYATQWSVEESSRQIDLTITADFNDQIMRLRPDPILPPCFWEGACTVSGTIGGQAVQGTAYAELTHSVEVAGDFDGDGDVDLDDFAVFVDCLNGPGNPPAGTCLPDVDADLDQDGDVDLRDFAAFAANFTGS